MRLQVLGSMWPMMLGILMSCVYVCAYVLLGLGLRGVGEVGDIISALSGLYVVNNVRLLIIV